MTWAKSLRFKIGLKIRFLGQKIFIFLWFNRGRERGGEGEEFKSSFNDPRTSIGQNSLSQELKFISSTRAMRTYQERGISPKIQIRRFGEIKCFALRRCS